MAWHAVGKTKLWQTHQRETIELLGRSILIIKESTKWYAIENLCSHADLPLEDGEVEDEAIICPFHGAKFCLRTGEHLAPPALSDIAIFPIRVSNDIIEIELN